jgi:uncharacterized membrane protein YfcA
MSELYYVMLMAVGVLAGMLGALTGLGGGIIVIPILTLFFHVHIYQAMAAGLIATLTTSSGAAAALLKEGYTNLKLGMLLEVGTAVGAIVGAWLVAYLPVHFIEGLFGVVLLFSAFMAIRRKEEHEDHLKSDPLAIRLGLLNQKSSELPGHSVYAICRLKLGFFLMTIAGMLSGLLGIGSGTVKVLAMDQVMRLPYRVSTSTSNFIIGITAAAGIGIYWSRGYVVDFVCAPIMLGVLAGAVLGGYLLVRLRTAGLRYVFVTIIGLAGIQMLYQGAGGLLK